MNKKEREFIKIVWKYYRRHGRRRLPWRLTKNPYRILVSEVMLQQTQVDRVIPKYTSFLRRFPSLASLASASLGDVLREWQGLGYNRRAKMLHQCAQKIVYEYKGIFPKDHSALMLLPGIGHYTAGAIMAFAYNKSVPIIETNIRTVFIHHFFYNRASISDTETFQSIERTLDTENPREWYWALMDYGVYLKKTKGNPNNQSKQYSKQTAFKDSDRQIRGTILRHLAKENLTRLKILKQLFFEIERIDTQLERLSDEGMIIKKRHMYTLP